MSLLESVFVKDLFFCCITDKAGAGARASKARGSNALERVWFAFTYPVTYITFTQFLHAPTSLQYYDTNVSSVAQTVLQCTIFLLFAFHLICFFRVSIVLIKIYS